MGNLTRSTERRVSSPEAAKELVERTDRAWALQSLAVGWMKVDVLARLVLVVVLAVVPVLMTYRLNLRTESTESQLREFSALTDKIARDPAAYATEQKAAEVARECAKMGALAEEYRNEIDRVGRLEVLALSVFAVLAVLVAIGQYRRYVAIKHLKTAVDFFRTDQGIAWLQSNKAETPDERPPPPTA